MDKKKKEDIGYKAKQDAKNGKYNPPHNGAFDLRPTVLGRRYSETEKEERRRYKRVHKHHK